MNSGSQYNRYSFAEVKAAADGRWSSILEASGIPADALNRRNRPCPGCGGRDRFRYIDKSGDGFFICNGGGDAVSGDGFRLLEHVHGWSPSESLRFVADFLGVGAREVTKADRAAWRQKERQARASRRAAQVALEGEQARAAEKASRIWQSTKPCDGDHPYLQLKGIEPHGTREDRHGNLVVPVYVRRALASLQFIAADGSKRFLRGGRTKGGYFPINGDPSTVVIAEGFATAATVAEATGYVVCVAFNAGNLQAVAEYVRDRLPLGDVVIAADMDRGTPGNPGLTKATQAAYATGARLAVPSFPAGVPGTDFNDLAAWAGQIDA